MDYRADDLDGEDSGGFIVLNVGAPLPNPYVVCEDADSNSYFHTLEEARAVCANLRRESGNPMIFVYSVTAIEPSPRM
jgi:hypothetical protein